jgi:DNA-binding Lrp family transcriptional regulator
MIKMSKSKKEITKNDRKILDVLMQNARQSLIEISDKTGLSRQTIQKTLQKLEKDNVIWGYQPIIDEQKKGLKEYIILIKRTTKPIDEKLLDKIISNKQEEVVLKMGIKYVTTLYTHGNFDIILIFIALDIKEVKKFIEYLKSIYSDYFADVQLLETLFTVRKQGIMNPNVINLKQLV